MSLIGPNAITPIQASENILVRRAGEMALLGGDVEIVAFTFKIRALFTAYETHKDRLGGLIGEFSLVGREVIRRLFPFRTGSHSTRGHTRQAILGPSGGDNTGGLLELDWVQDAQPFAWVAVKPPDLLTLDWVRDGQVFASNDVNMVITSSIKLAIRANASLMKAEAIASTAILRIEATLSTDTPPFTTSAAVLRIEASDVHLLVTSYALLSMTFDIIADLSAFTSTVTTVAHIAFPIRGGLSTGDVGKRTVKPCELPGQILHLTSNLPFGVWQTDPDAIFTWEMIFTCDRTAADLPIAVDGYLIVLDHTSSTAPWWDAARTPLTNKEYDLSAVPPYGPGSWWFHVSAYNAQGIGVPAHYNVRYNVPPGPPGGTYMRINGLDTLAQVPLVAFLPLTQHVLSWSLSTDIDPPDTIAYEVEIASSNSFGLNPSTGLSDIVLDAQSVPSNSLSIAQSLQPGVYFWRIRAFDGHQYSEWSPVGSFRINHPPLAPDELRVYQTG